MFLKEQQRIFLFCRNDPAAFYKDEMLYGATHQAMRACWGRVQLSSYSKLGFLVVGERYSIPFKDKFDYLGKGDSVSQTSAFFLLKAALAPAAAAAAARRQSL